MNLILNKVLNNLVSHTLVAALHCPQLQFPLYCHVSLLPMLL